MLPIRSRSIPRRTSVEALPKHRLTLGRQSIDMLVACRSRVDQVTIDISTDASVDVSIEVRFKIHDPKILPEPCMMKKMLSFTHGKKCNIYPTVLVTSVLVASLISYQDLLVLHQSTTYLKICSFSPSQPTTTKLVYTLLHTLFHSNGEPSFTLTCGRE